MRILVLLLLSACAASAQSPDPWKNFEFFAGEWDGTSSGQPGKGTGRRSYQFVLNRRFLEVRNASTYPPQEKNPKGEKHEDRGMISYDRRRKTHVFRQFHVEGFVNQYTLARAAGDGKTLVFESEAIENIPAGWRARETYAVLGPDEFSERFELAAPGKEFELYSESRWKRRR